MKVGIFTKIYKTKSIEELFKNVSDDGINNVQFNFSSIGLDPLPNKVDESILDEINKYKEKYNVSIDALTGTFNMVDSINREENIKQFEYQCYLASRINARVITLCTGSKNIDKWKWHEDNDLSSTYNELLEVTKAILKSARKYDVILGVEPEQTNVIHNSDIARRYLDDINDEYLKIVLDGANLFNSDNINNVDDTIRYAFDLLGKDIVSVHGKDIDKNLNYVCSGKGVVNFDLMVELLKQYNYDGSIIMHGLQYDEINYGRNYLRRIIDATV